MCNLKQFTLLQRLSIGSLVAMLITATLLVLMYREDQLTQFEKYASEANERILYHLIYTLDDQINAVVTNSKEANPQTLQTGPDFDSLFATELAKINEHDILKLKIYNQEGIVIYSSVKSEIGGGGSSPDLLARALRGETVHETKSSDTFSSKTGEMRDAHVYETYMPLTHLGKQIGAIESYDNAAPLFDRLTIKIIWISLVALGAFSALYAALFVAISRTDRAILEGQKLITKSRENLEMSQQLAALGSWEWDIKNNTGVVSNTWKEIFGIDAIDTSQALKSFVNTLHPDDRNNVIQAMEETLRTGKSNDIEYRIVLPDGRERFIHALGKVVFDPNGIPSHVYGTVQDITQHKKTEEELQIAAVVFETQDAVIITDASGNIIRANRAFTEVTGYSAEEVLGKNPRIMSSGRHNRFFFVEMWQQVLHSGTWSGEIWDKRKDGTIYPKWMSLTAVKNEKQETTQYVAIFSDISQRKHLEEEIYHLAFYDSLTNLPNRRLFLDRFGTAQSASARFDNYGAVLFIDMDNFKEVNDTLGHEIGDLLLKEVGMRIKDCVREMDTVSRFGGDEFAVLIENISQDVNDATHKVALVAEKIRDTLSQSYHLKEHEHHSSPSIGISLFRGNAVPVDKLLEQADMAMYQVKQAGRNAVRFFDPIMQQNVDTHDALKNDLRHAIDLKQLNLYYQVQVDNNNRPVGAEAFLRWMHPQFGILDAGQFIRIAERSSLIIGIGNWVLQTACQQLAVWSKHEKTRELPLTINISAKQFDQPDFVDQVAEMLKKHQFDPSHLKMYLSKRIDPSDISSALDKLHKLKNLGVGLSIENFGEVYATLSLFKQLSADHIKLDQEFVHGIMQKNSDTQLVNSILDLAKMLGMDVLAEGVETEVQYTFLRDQDCKAFQGYLFGKPVAIDEFDVLLGKL